MGVRLNGATSGYVELNAPSVAGTTSLELPTDSIKPGLVLISAQSFTAASTILVNNCFSSRYDSYRVVMDVTGVSGDGGFNVRLRTGGSPSATAYVQQRLIWFTSTTIVTDGNLSTTSWTTETIYNAYPGLGALTFDLHHPFLSTQTTGHMLQNASNSNLTVFYSEVRGVVKNDTTSYDGIEFTYGGTHCTGGLYVYGYRKAL